MYKVYLYTCPCGIERPMLPVTSPINSNSTHLTLYPKIGVSDKFSNFNCKSRGKVWDVKLNSFYFNVRTIQSLYKVFLSFSLKICGMKFLISIEILLNKCSYTKLSLYLIIISFLCTKWLNYTFLIVL